MNNDIFKRIFLTGIGAVALTVEKATEVIDDLVKKGELTFEQGKDMAKEYREKFNDYKSELDVKIESKAKDTLKGMNLATNDQVQVLLDRIEALEAKLAAGTETKPENENE